MSEHDMSNDPGAPPEAEASAPGFASGDPAGIAPAARDLTDDERAKLAQLDAELAKFEAQKRWADVIKKVLEKASVVVSPSDKVALFSQAGSLYLEKSSNQAEAIKCYEAVIEHDPNNLDALARLKEMYEKRRDWEKLIRVMRTETEMLPAADRAGEYIKMAQLATERLRKPEVCIDLWQKVLDSDAENAAALTNLAQLYERAREWQPLAKVLETQSLSVHDPKELSALLQKLGMIYADKLTDDAGAVSAFKRLLELDPNDRRAQEQLKKRFVALKAWDDLEQFYASTDKWDELIRTLEREAEQQGISDAERMDLLFRIARLWMTQKGKVDRASKCYEKILEIDPQSYDAAVALSPLYEASNEPKKLVGVYEVRLAHVKDPEERIQLLREAGLLYEEKIKDAPTAFERFLEAFGLDPMREPPREDVERLAPVVEGWSRVIAAYEKAIAAASDDDAVELRIHFGGVLAAVGRTEDAIAQYASVYEARPDKTDAMAALEQLYRETGRFDDLFALFTRRTELETDDTERRRLAYEAAGLLERELAAPARAIDAYKKILETWGDDEVDAFRALEGLYESQGLWLELGAILERRIDLGPSSEEELCALKFRLGRTLEQHLGDAGRAVDLYREILTIVPDHDGARAALEALLDDRAHGATAAQILEPIYEGRGDWASLVRSLEVLVAGPIEPEQKLELLTKIGEVASVQMGDGARAFEAFSRALAVSPESESTLAKLEILAEEQERFADLVTLVGTLAGKATDDDLSRTLWLKVAELAETRLADVDAAVGAYGRILDRNGGDVDVLLRLDALYRRTERWRDLLGVLRRRAEISSDPDEKQALLGQMAEIHDQMLEERPAAISLYREILELDPTSGLALASLDSLLEREALWSDLADNVGRQLAISTEAPAQTALMLRLADLREKRMGAVDAAIEIYREVLERDPTNEEALAALERLVADEANQVVIAEILEPLYREANAFEKLIGVHEIQVHHATSVERKVELLHRVAELYEVALDDTAGAFAAFSRALGEDPSSVDTQQQLERLARAGASWEAIAQVYERLAPTVEDPHLSASLHVKAAEIREEQLSDVEGAVAHYRRVLEIDPTYVDAATALERLFQLAERYEDLAGIYLTKAAMLTSPDEQKEYLFRAASIFEEILERPTAAIDIYKKVLEVDAEEVRALDKLIELNLRLEQWEPLLEVYTRKAEIVTDPEEKKRLFVEVGAVYEREKGDPAKAIDTYQRILEIDPDDLMAIARLDSLYQASENWEELLSVLEREADLASDPSEVISYKFRIADLWHHKLNDSTRAIEGYREILDVVPDHDPTLGALESMISEGKEPLAAAGVLEPVYRQSSEWAKLIAVHEVQIAHEADATRKVELLHRVAELYEFQLDQARPAFDAFARGVPLDSANDDTLQNVERLAEQLTVWPEVTALYDAQVEALRAGDPQRLVEMALRVAQIYEVQVGDVDSAIARYTLVMEADATHVQAIEALDRLYEATERWTDLAKILEREIQVAGTPDDVLAFQYRLGNVYQTRLNDIDQAIAQYKEILGAAPEHQAAREALEGLFAARVQPVVIGEILEPLYRMQEAWDGLVTVMEVQLEFLSDKAERVGMMHRIAETAEEKGGDHTRAFEWMQKSLLEDPMHERTNEEVDRLARILDGWTDLANTLADVLQTTEEAATQAFIGRRLAKLYETELTDVERAEETYRYVLSVDETDKDTLEALDRIYSESGAHEALAEILKKRIAATEDAEELVTYHFRLGQVQELELGLAEEAIATYRLVIDKLDPRHADSIRSLENIYLGAEDWPHLFEMYEKELEVVDGDTAQAELLARTARLASDHLGDIDKAIGIWRKVLDLRGEDPEALGALGDLYGRQENWRDLVEVLERQVSIADDDETRVRIYTDLGKVWYEKLSREKSALESYERVLEIDPTNTGALFALADIYRASQSHQELVTTLHRVIDVGAATLEDSRLEGVYMELGALYATTLQQPFDAVEQYRHVLDVNPRNFEAMDALETLHTQEAQWEDCISVKERRVGALEDPQAQIDVLLAIAKMWDEQVTDKDKGTSAYERVLTIDARHQVAFEMLEGLHRDAMRWEALVEMYLMRVESADDPHEQVALLRKVADVYEKEMDDRNKAFETLQVAWSMDYADAETGREIERLAAATQKWNELLASANEALQQVEDPDLKIAICLRCAKWYGTELGHPEYAIPYYQQILALDPANVPAMRQMVDLYRATQQWTTLAQVLGRLVDMTTDPTEKMDVYVQMGDLCDKHLGLPDQASKYYEQALEFDGAHLGALAALERIFRDKGQWTELLEVLRRKAGALTDPQEITDAKLQIAETYEDRLNDGEAAIATYKSVVDADPQNLPGLKGLERLYAQRERWQDLLGVLEAQFEVVPTEKDRILVLMRVAAMWEEEFVKPERAAERLEKVVDIDPTHDGALRGLERIYRNMQRWDLLIQTFDRHISATPDRKEKVDLYQQMGDVYSAELNDIDHAIDAYINLTQIDEQNVQGLDSLTRLYEKRGDHSAALDSMGQLARLVQDPAQIVDLRYRMGRLLDEQLGDRGSAIDQYQAALDVDPGHLPALEAMRKIHIDSGDWLAAARTLEQEAQYQTKPREVAKLLVDLGRIYDQQLDEHERAIECFEAAYKQDVDSEDAALPLVDEYMAQQRHADASPLLEMLVKRAKKRPNEEQHRLWFMLGEASEKLGVDELCLKAFSEAYALDSQHLPSLKGLAAVYYRTSDWDKAFKFYQMLLVHHRDALAREETVEIFYRLGVIKREQGERRKALNMFDKALEEDAHHRATLEAVVGLYEAQNEFEQVIHFKKQILETADEEERVKLLEEIGDLWKEKLNNAQKAIQSYAEAAELKGKDHRILHKLLALYQESRQWEKAIEIIQRVSDLDERTAAKSKYAYTVAVVLRDELKKIDEAVDKFNESLDLDHTQLKAFEAINKILTQKKDWKNLERAFRKMLHRIGGKGQTELEFNLWHNLGVIYRDRMQQFENAAEAFRVASSLMPDNLVEHQILAEIFAVIPNRVQDAINEHQWLLRQDPYRVDSYRALYKLYFDARMYDKAWCLASTLAFLKKADAEQAQFFEQYRVRGMIRPQSRLDNERWLKDLFHPDEDLYVGKIFESLTPAVLAMKQVPDKQIGLNKKQQVDPATSTVTFAKTFSFVAQVLNLPMPRLFLRPDVAGGLAYGIADPPASVCGNALLSGFNPQDLTFVVAKHLTYYRGEHYLRWVLPTAAELKMALLAGMRLAGLGVADPNVDASAAQIQQRLQPVHVEALRVVAKRFIEAGARTDIKQWVQSAELTACRAGFLVCNDLEIAARMIQSEPPAGPTDMLPKEKIKEIVLFSVSEQYFRLREALGITINIG